MAENFDGEPKPVSNPPKPDQQTLRDRVDVWEDTNSGVELDKLLAAQNNEGEPPAGDPPAGDPPAGDPPAGDPPAGDPPAGDPPAGDLNLPDPSTIKVPDDAGDPPSVEDIKPKEGEGDPPTDDADPYKDIQLPPNVRGKSAEAFATVKAKAASDLEARDTEIASLKTQLAELTEKVSTTPELPEDTQKELEDLRQFKAKLDIEADPNFHAEFDGKIERSRQFIFSQLTSAGFDKAAIDRVKEVGVENVDWEALSDKLNPQTKRLIQARLDEIVIATDDKQVKLDEVKRNVGDYIDKQRKSYSERGNQHLKDTEARLNEYYAKMPFLQEQEPLKATATENEKAVHKYNEEQRTQILAALDEAKKEDSPDMRALLIAGMGQLLHLKPKFNQLAEYSKKQDAKLAQALAWIDKVKKAGQPKNKGDSTEPTPPKPGVDYAQDAGSALDAYRKAHPGASA